MGLAVRLATRLRDAARRLMGSGAGARLRRLWPATKRCAAWMLSISVVIVVWGTGIEPRLVDEQWETARLPALPVEWEGAHVALIADLQVGMWLANTDTIRRIVARLIDQRPAAVLIAGDFLYHPTEESGEPREARDELEHEDLIALRQQIADVATLLNPLINADIPTVAVLGNHDYAMRWPESLPLPAVANEMSAALEAMGVTVLRNQAVPLGSRDGQLPAAARLHVAGLDAWFPGATDVEGTLARIPADAPRLWLVHNPLAFRQLPPNTAPVALAAHTHGGQIRLPFTERWSWMSLAKESPVAADGWIAPEFGEAGNRLYVNRGIGFSLVPVRINCRPELTWLVLRGAEPN